jgi:hypothetical protein
VVECGPAWGGYALFWCCLELPCQCMGEMIDIPSSFSISLDSLFFLSSLALGFFLGAKGRYLYLSLLIGLFTGLVGYAFGEWIYKQYIL